MGDLHILWNRDTQRPWWPTEQRMFGTRAKSLKRRVFTDCCSCWMPAHRTVCRLSCQEIPVMGDLGDYGYAYEWGERAAFSLSYYEPEWRVQCDPQSGCKADKRKLRGAYLRSVMHYG